MHVLQHERRPAEGLWRMGLTSWEAAEASAVAMASALSCCQEFLVVAGLFLHRCLLA